MKVREKREYIEMRNINLKRYHFEFKGYLFCAYFSVLFNNLTILLLCLAIIIRQEIIEANSIGKSSFVK